MSDNKERVVLSAKSAEELFEAFLDTDDLFLKRRILGAGATKFTRRMINVMAISCDTGVDGKSDEEDLRKIDEYLALRIKYEGRRQ